LILIKGLYTKRSAVFDLAQAAVSAAARGQVRQFQPDANLAEGRPRQWPARCLVSAVNRAKFALNSSRAKALDEVAGYPEFFFVAQPRPPLLHLVGRSNEHL
jgi:hypothetical protein